MTYTQDIACDTCHFIIRAGTPTYGTRQRILCGRCLTHNLTHDRTNPNRYCGRCDVVTRLQNIQRIKVTV